ncbi:hypothetical protein LCGC14_2250920, partial [marine sediment metagenome]
MNKRTLIAMLSTAAVATGILVLYLRNDWLASMLT